MAQLATNECKGTCSWHATDRRLAAEPVFECSSCRSEWIPTESWVPRNADGDISPEVEAARRP